MIEQEIKELEHMEKSDVRALIAELLNNQRQIKTNRELYYNEELDQIWIRFYYASVTAIENTDSNDLFDEYHELVSKTHEYKLPYYISKDQYLYTWVDLQPNGKLKCIYSGNRKNPQKLIEEDFEVIEKRFIRYRDLIKRQRYSKQRMNKKVKNISNKKN